MPRPLEPEARIGSYELVRRIGVGGMAEVWVARRVSERRASKYVAIKVVADQHVGDPRFHRMFKTEVELSALLNHVNIVQVFDEGEDDGRSYLVMEWVDGVNLLKVEAALTFVDDEAWRLKVITYIVGQLLYALNYAHSITLHDGNPLGIVHRDVSPQNVLVSAQGEVKLTDFGVAHYMLEESSGVHVKGKLRYMAPEQLAGKTRDPRLDLYAVGAILHELLDGRRFRYDVEDQRDMYIEVISGKVPALSRSVPPELDALRLGLLEPDMKRRIPTADAALEQLARFPGYGDARRELTQLCGGLTGVMRPRVGPGQSEPVAAATGVSIAAPRAEASRAASSAGPAAASVASVGASASPVRSTTLRLGHEAAARLPVEQDATQPWVASAMPHPVGQVSSAPISVMNEATDPAAPGSAGRTIAVTRRRSSSAVAVVVAMASVAVVASLGASAWWLVVERPRASVEARPTVDDRPLEPPPQGLDEPTTPPPATRGTPEHAPAAGSTTGVPSPPAETASTGDHDEATAASTEDTGSTSGAEDAGGVDDTSMPQPSESKPAPPKPTAPRVQQALTVVAVAALGAVQVEVRSKDGSVRKRYALRGSTDGDRLPVGSYTVRWRPAGASQWSKSQGVTLRRGCDLRVVVDAQQVKSIPMGASCR